MAKCRETLFRGTRALYTYILIFFPSLFPFYPQPTHFFFPSLHSLPLLFRRLVTITSAEKKKIFAAAWRWVRLYSMHPRTSALLGANQFHFFIHAQTTHRFTYTIFFFPLVFPLLVLYNISCNRTELHNNCVNLSARSIGLWRNVHYVYSPTTMVCWF